MWWVLPSLAALCDPAALSVGIDALDAADDATVARLTASDMSDACTFDDPIQAALVAVGADESHDSGALRKLEVFKAVCPRGAKPERAALWRKCDLESLGVFTRDDWLAGNGPAVLALVVHRTLLDDGVSPDTAQILARRLAGIPRESRSRVIDVFEPLYPTFP